MPPLLVWACVLGALWLWPEQTLAQRPRARRARRRKAAEALDREAAQVIEETVPTPDSASVATSEEVAE